MNGDEKAALDHLEAAAGELADLHRPKHYGLWRSEAAPRLGDELGRTPPFSEYRDLWVHTGDGGNVQSTARFGEWAIDRLVEKKSPEEILALFDDEVVENIGRYADASPVFGVELDEICHLGDGVDLVPEPSGVFESLLHRSPFQSIHLPTGTATLRQAFTVSPAFNKREPGDRQIPGTSVTTPPRADRDTVRTHVRLACLLSSSGPVELPLTALHPDHGALFVAGEGNSAGRPFAAHPLVSFPVEAVHVKRAYDALKSFSELDSLARSIDRLGRSRLAASSVDRALELGIAAEIALMHGQGEGNAEITHKIGTRAAWLLGQNPVERETIFAEMKLLYAARSQAVHSGILSSRSKIDLDAADALVGRALRAILDLGRFPQWASLTMGGDGAAIQAAAQVAQQ